MNENKTALDVLSDQIIFAIKKICEKLDFDRTYTGIISSVHSDGYTVKYNGTEIKIKTKDTSFYKVNSQVTFCIPCGNKRRAYIIQELEKISIKEITPEINTNYFYSNDNAGNIVFQYDKMVIVSINIKFTQTSTPASTVIFSKLPKNSASKCICGVLNTNTGQVRTKINPGGTTIIIDGATTETGWFSGQLIYFTD